jgi:hypothetical protein
MFVFAGTFVLINSVPHGLCLKMTWRSAARHKSPRECFARSPTA